VRVLGSPLGRLGCPLQRFIYVRHLHPPRLRTAHGKLARILEKGVQPGDTIAIIAGDRGTWYGGTILEGIRHYANPPAPAVLMTQPARSDLLARLRNNHSLWIIEGDCDQSSVSTYFPPGGQYLSTHRLLDIGHTYQITWKQ
jgi:hypothetical protein